MFKNNSFNCILNIASGSNRVSYHWSVFFRFFRFLYVLSNFLCFKSGLATSFVSTKATSAFFWQFVYLFLRQLTSVNINFCLDLFLSTNNVSQLATSESKLSITLSFFGILSKNGNRLFNGRSSFSVNFGWKL